MLKMQSLDSIFGVWACALMYKEVLYVAFIMELLLLPNPRKSYVM